MSTRTVRSLLHVVLPAALVLPAFAHADVIVAMHAVTDTGIGDSLGEIAISDATHGVVLTPTLTGRTASRSRRHPPA